MSETSETTETTGTETANPPPPNAEDEIIRFDNLSKRFGDVTAVHPTSFSVRRGEFFALLGPSGCGKTTLLRMLSGFHAPSEGRIFIDGEDVTALPANRRPINMVFQSYAVFPHMSVGQNVAYGLKIARVPKDERARRVEEVLSLVQLNGMAERRPSQLSGGQQQRVALARALVMQPKVLLLDEPLSALDAKLREHMRGELVRLQKQVGITFIIVTHDQDEALSMADRVAVMNGGRLEQLAPPQTLYESPSSRFVADFIGRINFFAARVVAENGARVVASPVLGTLAPALTPPSAAEGEEVTVALRPEKIEVQASPPTGDDPRTRSLPGVIAEVSYYGDYCTVEVDLRGAEGSQRVTSFVPNAIRETGVQFSPGQEVWCAWWSSDILVIDEAAN
ncbi:MAG: ABC transporter ATP-binding protein [Alphaproteobacteria bacterium]|nr:ABC transporter ATP-binding protein [Alphaproteobacteria bacterium]MDA8004154.1 ABC transporter ATP-binding protein [Alphaproteobacteria bacterium]MDA8006160.1 ABC transporter ATP-binding protein [Alphaproteobacteria bacterium]MDA8013520.1 ABC transporter ATP-binding protein [Alphaproteobacteria bacterium]